MTKAVILGSPNAVRIVFSTDGCVYVRTYYNMSMHTHTPAHVLHRYMYPIRFHTRRNHE